MNRIPTNREEAAEVLLEFLVAVGYDGLVAGITSELERGPRGRAPDPVALHRWYVGLDDHDRAMVLEIVRQAARFSVFNCLTFLDGRTGGRYREGKVLEFALYLDVYREEGYGGDAVPERSIRVNPIHEAVEDLHDLFNGVMQQRAAGSADSGSG